MSNYFQGRDDLLLSAAKDNRAAVLPSSGLFYEASTPDAPPMDGPPLYRTRIDGVPVELCPVGRDQGIWLDVLRLGRMMPAAFAELVQTFGYEEAGELLSAGLVVSPGEVDAAVVKGEVAENDFSFAGGWLEGVGSPAPVPEQDELPALLDLSLRFPDLDIRLIGIREALFRRLELMLRGRLGYGLAGSPCFLAFVERADSGVVAVSPVDFQRSDLRDLIQAFEGDEPGRFEALLSTLGILDPAQWPHVRSGRQPLPPWTVDEARDVITKAYALAMRSDTNALAYFDHVFADIWGTTELDSELATMLTTAFRLWCRLALQTGGVERVLPHLDVASRVVAPAAAQQEIRYLRGCLNLQMGLRPGAESLGLDRVAAVDAFPAAPSRETVRFWLRARRDFEMAVELDPQDHFAWARTGLVCTLLGGFGVTLPLRRRQAAFQRGIEALKRAQTLWPAEHAPPALDTNLRHCEEGLAALADLPWWVRTMGRVESLLDVSEE